MPSGDSTKMASPRKKATEQVEPVAETPTAQAEPAAPPKRKPRASGERMKRRSIALPVLVVDETVLLPHMSIPFPIEDEEAALVIERASRMPNRQILVLTERPVKEESSGDQDAAEFRDLFADLGRVDLSPTEPESVV